MKTPYFNLNLNRNLTLPLFLSLSILAGTSIATAGEEAQTESQQAEKLTDGTYEGSYRRLAGMARVKVIVENGKIAGIDIIRRFCSPWGRKAFEQMPGRILESHSTEVDAVSGATYSSDNIKRAVEDALKKARSPQGP